MKGSSTWKGSVCRRAERKCGYFSATTVTRATRGESIQNRQEITVSVKRLTQFWCASSDWVLGHSFFFKDSSSWNFSCSTKKGKHESNKPFTVICFCWMFVFLLRNIAVNVLKLLGLLWGLLQFVSWKRWSSIILCCNRIWLFFVGCCDWVVWLALFWISFADCDSIKIEDWVCFREKFGKSFCQCHAAFCGCSFKQVDG